MRLTISPRAEQDLREIGSYIAANNLSAAISFVERLQERCRDLLAFPSAGRNRDDIKPGYRSATEGDYVILYLPGERELVIVRIIHGKRDLGKAIKD